MQSLHELAARIQSTVLPAWNLPDIVDLVEGFVTLVAFARRYENKDEVQPFLTVRIHFWIRELTRMVVSLPSADATAERDAEEATPSAPARLLHARDLSLDHPETALPVVHCRECGGMAWIALETLEGSGFDSNLDPIYSAYFARQPAARLTYLLPQQPAAGVLGGVRPVPGHVCRRCLHWQLEPSGQCPACGHQAWRRVWRARPKWIMDRTDPQRQKSACCTYCGSGTGTGIFGVSATSIVLCALVSLLFASKANGDPKLLAFGDSVQDVAHKAGFVEARSFRILLRQAIARWWATRQVTCPTHACMHDWLWTRHRPARIRPSMSAPWRLWTCCGWKASRLCLNPTVPFRARRHPTHLLRSPPCDRRI